MNNYILGIDTSNYRTSIAVVDNDGTIVIDKRCLLRVKKGERGLRQSEALFQHVENLPKLFETLTSEKLNIIAVAVSNKPRPIEGSYMPCFKAGYGFGKAIANTLNVPLLQFSHQEGHLEAIKHYSSMNEKKSFLAWHLSGGTCELLRVVDGEIEIAGGSKDISFGQVIDRVGVLLGMNFPAGEEMDLRALQVKTEKETEQLTMIKLDGLYFNLSGIETQCNRLLQSNAWKNTEFDENFLIKELFDKITTTIASVSAKAADQFGIEDIIFAGGVSCSKYISNEIKNFFANKEIKIEFGRQDLSGDNAVGIALLGGKSLWQ
nr:O-sialoglycoprotein endopeptidase [uncultured Aminipila sp.]